MSELNEIKFVEGNLSAEGLTLGIVASRFNDFIVEKLVGGALDCWKRHGGKIEAITLVKVPGAWEIPFAAQQLANKEVCDAIVCLGAIIRGSTPHFDFVASENAKGIAQLAMNTNIPILYGVLTTDTIEQAIERAGTKAGNKGWDATLSAIEMANLYKQF